MNVLYCTVGASRRCGIHIFLHVSPMKNNLFFKYGATRLVRKISFVCIGEFVRSPQESEVGSTAAVSC